VSELSTFGAICRFAIELEAQAAAHFERAAQAAAEPSAREAMSALAKAHRKRQRLVEQIRQQNVTEMILEPVYGLKEEDWQLVSTDGILEQIANWEATIRGFYTAAAAKVSIPQVARQFLKLASEHLEEHTG